MQLSTIRECVLMILAPIVHSWPNFWTYALISHMRRMSVESTVDYAPWVKPIICYWIITYNWPNEVKPYLYFSQRLNNKIFRFVLPWLFTEVKSSYKMFKEEAVISLLNMHYVSHLLINLQLRSAKFVLKSCFFPYRFCSKTGKNTGTPGKINACWTTLESFNWNLWNNTQDAALKC